MTHTLTASSTLLSTERSRASVWLVVMAALAVTTLSACSADAEQTITERNTVVLSDAEAEEAAEDTDYLNPERDPEGDGLQGEPVEDPQEAVDYESINENTDGNDPVETADRDADPLD